MLECHYAGSAGNGLLREHFYYFKFGSNSCNKPLVHLAHDM